MPFTPFHFGAHACAVLPFRRRLDIPAFVLSNVVIDIEPLLVMLFNLNYPLHGYAHTFLGGLIIGSLWGVIAYTLRGSLGKVMNFLRLFYAPTVTISIVSGALGACLHILFDAPIHPDIKPFYPMNSNPLYGSISTANMYFLCLLFFIPAIVLYLMTRRSHRANERTR
jgi:membrane-bound metal-dependent hydrolase YbcI (DUF457 family)